MKKPEIIKKELYEKGFCRVENVFKREDAIRYEEKVNDYFSAYSDLDRNAEMMNKESQITIYSSNLIPAFDEFKNWPADPKMIGLLKEIFQEHFILSNWNISGAPANSKSEGRLHIDSRMPISDPKYTTHVIFMVALSEFTEDNGATVLYEKSHLSGKDPRHLSKEDVESKYKKQFATMNPGDVTVFLGQSFHDVGVNVTNKTRWGIIGYFTLWWIKPTFDFTSISPVGLSDDELMIYGFRSRSPHPFDQNKYTVR